MSVTTDSRIKQKIMLKDDWYALRLNAFPSSEKELLEQATFFKLGTLFVEYDKLDPEDKTPLYGWMYEDNGVMRFAHMFAPTLNSWRSFKDMFVDYYDV